MTVPASDRRDQPREPLFHSRRRYPRVSLDVDWFVESSGCSTLGRGLEISPRGALLSIERTGPVTPDVTLHVCLPGRATMFRARGIASPREGEKGWVIRFTLVSTEDLALLATVLVEEYGLGAIPGLDRKFPRYTPLPKRYLRSSI